MLLLVELCCLQSTMYALVYFLLLLNSFCWSTSPPDYSRSSSPIMRLGIVRLEAGRPELVFGNNTIPKTHGYIEIVCRVEFESVYASLGEGNMTLRWNAEIENMIKNGRAYEKNNGPDFITTSTVAITNMLPEDAGEHTCTLIYEGEATVYKRAINIPALDGSPILRCDIDCDRNTDENCQVLQYQIGTCFSYGFPKPKIQCRFDQCDSESSCPQALSFPLYPEPPYHARYLVGGIYQSAVSVRAADNVATASGRYYCEASNLRGTSNTSLYLPVSAGLKKHPEFPSYDDLQKASEDFFGKSTGVFLVGERKEISCFSATDDIEWTYFNVSSNQTMHHSSINNSYPVMYIKEKTSASGSVSQIIIPELSLYNGGTYECKQASGNGSALSFGIDTFTWAEDSNMNQNLKVTKLAGDSMTMSCTITTLNRKPSIYWKKDGQHISRHSHGSSSDNQILTIPRLTLKDSGVYTCSSDYSIGIERFHIKGMLDLKVVDSLVDEDVILFRSMISTLEDLKKNLLALAEKRQH